MLGYLLSTATAVYRGHSILVICEDRDDFAELKSARSLQMVRDALKENRKDGYSVLVENCSPDKYVPGSSIRKMQNENLFDFGDGTDLPPDEV